MGILEKRGQHRNLPQTHLDIMRLKDANVAAKAKV
jgi:hypothetical protein